MSDCSMCFGNLSTSFCCRFGLLRGLALPGLERVDKLSAARRPA